MGVQTSGTGFIKGMIIMWSGSIATIPNGWALCDGTNGAPDLRDRFIVGAGSDYNPDDTGGENQHDHSFTGDGHYHEVSGWTDVGEHSHGTDEGYEVCQSGGSTYVTQNNSISVDNATIDLSSETMDNGEAVGDTDTTETLPPYYALAFIMKT